MSRLKNSLIISAAVVTLGGAALVSANTAVAQSTGQSLVQKIASRFNLGEDEVEAVFDEYRDERRAEMLDDASERLQDKVDDGDITAEQKTLIENKLKEVQDARESERDALEAWAEDNSIDLRFIVMGHGPFGRGDDRLDDAVADGDLIREKKNLIETKLDELQNQHQAARDDLEQWAQENGIELADLMPIGHGMGGHMIGHGQ